MHKWYVAQVLTAKEKKVKKTIEDHSEMKEMNELIEKIILPTKPFTEVKNGQKNKVKKKPKKKAMLATSMKKLMYSGTRMLFLRLRKTQI